MTKFKVGDKVVRLNSCNPATVKGGIYTVRSINLNVIFLEELLGSFLTSNFKLLEVWDGSFEVGKKYKNSLLSSQYTYVGPFADKFLFANLNSLGDVTTYLNDHNIQLPDGDWLWNEVKEPVVEVKYNTLTNKGTCCREFFSTSQDTYSNLKVTLTDGVVTNVEFLQN